MSGHLGEELWELALGTLGKDERASATSHVAECAACAAELRAAEEALALVAVDLPPVTPSPEVLDRLLASTQGRYHGLIEKVARMWDLGRDKVRELFGSIPAAKWEPSGLPGVDLFHITPGPAAAHADAGFVKFAPGMQFPHHSHIGDELQLILDGVLTDDAGIEYRVGDTMFRPVGTAHSFIIGPEGCILALSLVGGIVIDGVRYGAK